MRFTPFFVAATLRAVALVAASTDHLATKDEAVARAVRFIKQHACEGVSVEKVARATGIGRRTLERRFREVVGKGVDEQIRKSRMRTHPATERMVSTSVRKAAACSGRRAKITGFLAAVLVFQYGFELA